MKKKPKLNPSLPLTLRNYFSHPLKLNARGNLLDACPKVECSGQPTSAGTIAVSVCKPVPAKYALRFLFIKIDRVILTQVGFCVISPWSLSRFLPNHKKALLRWLLHLHINFQLILPRRLPCRRDRPLTLFYANNRSYLRECSSDSYQSWYGDPP